ncbi:MAG: sigma-70 family RNA polymerase sigma factor [Chloroflexota bacterium]
MSQLESLVLTAQRGDLDAFTEIVVQFQDMAYAIAYSASGDPHLAEDAAQEAFVEAYRHLSKLDNAAAFPGWFQTIIKRQVNRLTRRKQIVSLELNEALDLSTDHNAIDVLIEKKEMRQFVQSAIRALPDHERQVIALFYMTGYSQQEIADFLHVRVSTVKNRLFSARKRLRKRMITIVKDDLQAQRPSNDNEFTKRVLEMLSATKQGDADKVDTLLTENPDLLQATGDVDYWSIPQPPLHVAVTYGNREMIDLLLKKGADINAKDPEGQRPLDLVVGWNQPIADFLLERGAEIDIFAAAILGDLDGVEAFLAEDSDLATTRGPEGATPLHVAATVEIAELLLAHGADINALDSYTRRPPIGWAAGGLPVRQFLLEQGATVDTIMLACRIGDLPRVKEFLATDPSLLHTKTESWDDHGEGATLLHIAAAKGGVEMTRFFLEQGLDPNATGGWWQVCPLHWAVEKENNMTVLQLLIDHGADVNARSGEKGIPPLSWARNDYVKFLLDQGADVNGKSDDGTSALHQAADYGAINKIRILIEHGADKLAKNKSGVTALDVARLKQHDEVANYLQP